MVTAKNNDISLPVKAKQQQQNCLTCRHFLSFETIYEDENEPYDMGKCGSPINDASDEICDDTTVCDNHEPEL